MGSLRAIVLGRFTLASAGMCHGLRTEGTSTGAEVNVAGVCTRHGVRINAMRGAGQVAIAGAGTLWGSASTRPHACVLGCRARGNASLAGATMGATKHDGL